MLFFLLPFGLLAALVAAGAAGPLGAAARADRAGRPGRWRSPLVAFYQYAAKDVFWNPKIIVGNEYASFFRVNSLFWDASIYGRFMAMTIVLVSGVAVYRRLTPPLGALIVVLFAGLYLAYSQSSLLALVAGSLVLATTVWPRRVTIAVIAAGLAIGLGGAGRVAGRQLGPQRVLRPLAPARPGAPRDRRASAGRRRRRRLRPGGGGRHEDAVEDHRGRSRTPRR